MNAGKAVNLKDEALKTIIVFGASIFRVAALERCKAATIAGF